MRTFSCDDVITKNSSAINNNCVNVGRRAARLSDYRTLYEAVRWYRLAALHGSASAQAAMGTIAKDTGQAIRWYRLADAQNTVVATSQLNTLEADPTSSAEDSGEY